jgi:hypothetical protein
VVEAYDDRIEKAEDAVSGPRDGLVGGDLPDQARPAHVPPSRGALRDVRTGRTDKSVLGEDLMSSSGDL